MTLWRRPDPEAVAAYAREAAAVQRRVDALFAGWEADDRTPPVIDRVARWSDIAPWLPPGVILGLSEGGVDPDSAAGRQVASAHIAHFGGGTTYPRPTTGAEAAHPTPPGANTPDPVTRLVAGPASWDRLIPPPSPADDAPTDRAVASEWDDTDPDELAEFRDGFIAASGWSEQQVDDLFAFARNNGLSRETIGKQYVRDARDGNSFGTPSDFIRDATKDRPSLWERATAPARGIIGEIMGESVRRGWNQPGAGRNPVTGSGGPEGAAGQAPEVLQLGTPLQVTGEGLGMVSRPTFAALDVGMQATQASFRNMVSGARSLPDLNPFDGGGPSLGQTNPLDLHGSMGISGETDLGIMAETLVAEGRLPDLGGGLFPNTYDPESEVGAIRMEREAAHGQIGGHNITIGRWIANRAFEPDTLPFDIVSGLTDATVAVFNPGDMAAGAAWDGIRGFRTVSNWRRVDEIVDNPAFLDVEDIVRRVIGDEPGYETMGVHSTLEQYLVLPEASRTAMRSGRDFEAPGIFGAMTVDERRAIARHGDDIEEAFGSEVVTRNPWVSATDEDVADPDIVAGAAGPDEGTFSQAALTRAGAARWEARTGLGAGDVPDLPAHQLTLDEFSRSRWSDQVTADELAQAHESIVARAIARDDDVPASVLLDHPGLIPPERLRELAEVDTGVLTGGFRPDIERTTFDRWLDTRRGRSITQALADTTNTYDVWRMMGQRVPPDIAAQIADLSDPQLVADLLRRHAGIDINPAEIRHGIGWADQTIDQLADTTASTWRGRARHSTARALGFMPVATIDTEDLGQAAQAAERWMRNAALPTSQIRDVVDRIARVRNPEELFTIVTDDMAGALKQTLLDMGVDREWANHLSRAYRDRVLGDRAWAVSDDGSFLQAPKMLVDGQAVDAAGPMLASELVGRHIPLPGDPRDIRRAISAWGPVVTNPYAMAPVHVAEYLTGAIWKPLTLIRPAWATRVVLEEQLRLAGAGLDSAFRHPVSYLAMLGGRKLDESLLDEPLTLLTEHADAMSRMGGAGADAARVYNDDMMRVAGYKVLGPHDDGYIAGWANELVDLAHDPVARQVANYGVNDETLAWFMRGGGSVHRERFIRAGYPLDDPDQAERFLGALAERFTHATRSNPELEDIVRTGRLNVADEIPEVKVNGRVEMDGFDRPGKVLSVDGDTATVRFTTPDGNVITEAFPLADLTPVSHGTGLGLQGEAALNPRLTGLLNNLVDSGANIPQRIVGEHVEMRSGARVRANHLVDAGFNAFGSMPTNKLSRSPAFRQFYWRRAGEMIPYMDEAGRVAARAKAVEQGVSRKVLRQIDDEIANTPVGTMTMRDVDEYARRAALRDTQDVLFDMSERRQFFDIFRVLFPFGDAWLEVLTRWAGITRQNPMVMRRLEQGITTGRSEGWFSEGAFGDEVFQYGPVSWALDGLAPQNMEGRLQGLNMLGDIYPGVGPAIQIPASLALGERADRQEWLELLTPYGAPENIQDAMIPPYMRRFLSGFMSAEEGWGQHPWAQWVPDEITHGLSKAGNFFGLTDTVRFERTRKDIMDYLVSTGEWPTSTVEEQDALLAEAGARASLFLMAQGTAQSILPTTPIADWKIETDAGLAMKAELLDEWYELQAADYDTAMATMLDRHGENLWLALQGKTRGVSLNAPLTHTPLQWVFEHPEVVDRYPNTYGLFAPQPTEAEDIDSQAFDRLIRTGGRENLTARQMLNLAQDRLGWSLYNAERDQFGERLTEGQARYMQAFEEYLLDTYPGWQTAMGLTERSTVEQNIREIRTAVSDPIIADTPAGQGTIAFLEGWDEAMARGRDVSTANIPFASSQQTAPLRAYLRDHAAWVISEHPEFEPVWRMVFERAIIAPDEEQQ